MFKIIYTSLIVTMSFLSKGQIQEIQINSVESDMTTTFRIECANFEKYLSEEITKRVLTQKDDIRKFQFELCNVQKTKSVTIDVRAKIVIKSEGKNKADTLCADSFYLRYKGSYFKMSNGLREIIWHTEK